MRKIPEYKKKDIDIDSFQCKRLKYIRENIKSQIRDLVSERNPGIGKYLHFHSWREEINNYRAYYVVMDDEEIVLYFSLQMGAMIKCNKKEIRGIIYQPETDTHRIEDDKIEIDTIVPAIEMVHFCINDRYKIKRNSWIINYKGIEYKVGQYIFYKYIVPIVIEAAENVGFQYLTLFCADDEHGSLEKHYKTMGFERMDDMACLRDKYSKDLECLTIKIGDLVERYMIFEDPTYHNSNKRFIKFRRWKLQK